MQNTLTDVWNRFFRGAQRSSSESIAFAGVVCPLCEREAKASEPMKLTTLRTCEDKQFLGDHRVLRCERCGSGLTYPPLQETECELVTDGAPASMSALNRFLLRTLVSMRVRRARAAAPGNRLLDVGAGACAFANEAARQGFAVTALEPTEKNRKFAASGVTFLPALFNRQLLEDARVAGQRFDLITFWHSLEHFPDPGGALAVARELLAPGGRILISVPDWGSPQSVVGGNYWTYLDVPHHIFHFTREGLNTLLRSAGWKVTWRYPISFEYDVFGWMQTLLNLVSRSHNVFYNQKKKLNPDWSYVRFPRWTRLVNKTALAWLPISGALTLLCAALRKPSCLELVCSPRD